MANVISYKGQKYVRVDNDINSIISEFKSALNNYKKEKQREIEKSKKRYEETLESINQKIKANEDAVKRVEQMLKSGKTKQIYKVASGYGDIDWLIASDKVRNTMLKNLG